LSNAVKYTNKGSIEVKLKPSHNIVFEIKDTGIGISQANQKKLFDKFYRVRVPATMEVTGSGLGLWISKKLVEMMKGKIWFESKKARVQLFILACRGCRRDLKCRN